MHFQRPAGAALHSKLQAPPSAACDDAHRGLVAAHSKAVLPANANACAQPPATPQHFQSVPLLLHPKEPGVGARAGPTIVAHLSRGKAGPLAAG
jgi:hypothetical protein